MLLITKNGGIDMRKTRKRVLELLAFVMVVLTAVSCISFLAPIAASAAVQDPTLTDLTFVVPEAIYLAPNSASLTSATSSSFQYYVNNTVTGAAESTAGTTGRVYYKYDGASNATLTYKFLDKNLSALSGGSITHPSSLTSGTAGSITAGMSPSLGANVTGCYIQWTLKFTDAKDSNKQKNAIAYTYVYKPNVMPAAGGADAGAGAGGANWAGNITWISGVHSVSYIAGNGEGNEDYDDNGDYFAYITGDRGFSAFIQKDNPAYMGSTRVTSGTKAKINSSSWTSSTAGADMQYVVYGGTNTSDAAHITTAGSNNSGGAWGSPNAGSNVFSVRNLEWGKYRRNAKKVTVTCTSDAVANITIDSSRYSNLKDIPQLAVGMMVTDDEKSKGGSGNWYVADSTGQTGFRTNTWYDNENRLKQVYDFKNYMIAGESTSWDNMSHDETEGLRYAGAWPRTISESTPMYTIHGFYGNKDKSINGSYYATSHTFVDLKATYNNKAALRTAVQNALKAFPNFSVTSDSYATSAFESSQTNSRWNSFVNAYKNAYKALTQVDGTSVDVANLAKNLNDAVAALSVRTTFNPNGGTINGSSSAYTTGWQVIGKNANISVNYSGFVPVRPGYAFKGWADTANASTGDTSNPLTVGHTKTLYAVWEKKTLDINFDNLFSLSDWSYNSISPTLNNKTDASVTVDRNAGTITVNTGANSGTDVYTQYGTADCYKVKVEPNTTYRLQFDYTTTAGAQAFVFSYNLSNQPVNFAGISNPHIGVYPTGSGSSGITFTTSSTTEYVQFRFGNTAKNDTSVFSNIKVYKNSAPFTEITYPAVRWAYTYDSSTTATGLITPVRNGYTFDGWYTNVNGVGTKYTTATNVPSSSITLWSNWTLDTYNLILDSNGGTNADNITYDITKTVQLPTPTRTGYTFAGWKPSADSGNWSASTAYTGELTRMYGNATLVAQWNPISYTINYLSGTGESTSVTVNYDETVSLIENPFTKQCSEFTGWLLSTDSNIYQPGTSVSNLAEGNGDVVYLTAQWEWAHTYVGVVTTPPTRTKTGVMTNTCSVCGDSYTVTVPAIGGQSVVFDPNNGANANYFVGVSGVNTDWKPSNGKYIKTYNGLTFTYDPANETFTVDGTYDPEGEGFIDFYNFDLPGVNIGDNTYAVTFEYVSGSRPADVGDRAIPCLYLMNANGAEFAWNDCNVDSSKAKSSYTTSCNVNGAITAKLQLYYCEGGNAAFDNFTFKIKVEAGSSTAYSPAAILAKNGSTVSGFMTPVWDEHKFEGWYLTNFDGEAITSAVVDGDLVIRARWTRADVVEATCETSGYTRHYYTDDETKYYDTDVVVQLGHDWTDGQILQAATCKNEGIQQTVCSRCKKTGTKKLPIDPDNHVGLTSTTVTKEANCTEAGSQDITCLDCNKKIRTEEIPALGHQLKDTVYAPSCTAQGYTSHICQRQGCTYSYNDSFTDMTPHPYNDGVVTKKSTCKEQGEITYTCTVCGYKDIKPLDIDPNNHAGTTHTEVTTEAKCETDGVLSTICDDCSKVIATEVIPATGHDWDEGVITKPPTETEKGEKTFTCKKCGATRIEEIPELAHEHSYTETVVAPTCTEDGYTLHKCRCGNEYKDNIVPNLGGHKYVKTVVKTANCIETGTNRYECSVCHNVYEETVAVDPHNHVGATYDQVINAPTCESDGATGTYCESCHALLNTTVNEKLGHEWVLIDSVASTCAAKGYELKKCSRCHTTKTFDLELDPDNHTGSTYEYIIKNVTCTEDGIVSIRCTGCDHEFETRTVTATGHNYESVVTKEAKCEIPGELRYTCKNCGDTYTEEIPALEHNYVGVVTTPNSCFNTGIKTFTCSLCSKSYTEVIPAIGHHDYKELIDLPATCTEEGHATYTCAVCGDSYEKTLPAAGHFYEDIVVEATCQHGGYTIHTCIVCGDSYTDSETPVSDHHWDEGVELKGATCTRAATILYTCKDCGTQKAVTVGTASHKYGDWEIIKEATCYEYGIRSCECSVCGQGKTEFIPYADHHFVKDGVDSDGVHWSYCDVCDKKIVTNAEDGSQHEKDACDICGKVHKKGDLFATLFCFVMRIVKFFRNLFNKG